MAEAARYSRPARPRLAAVAPTLRAAASGTGRPALAILTAMALVVFLPYASAVCIPVTVAILITYGLSPPVAWLRRRGVPRALAAALVLLCLLGLVGVGVYTLSDQVVQIVDRVPVAARHLRDQLDAHRRVRGGVVEKVQRAAKEVDQTAAAATAPAASTGDDKVTPVAIVAPPFSLSDHLWSGGLTLIGVLEEGALVLSLVSVFLVTGDLYKRKLVRIAGPSLARRKLTLRILREISRQIEGFMRVTMLASAMVAAATAAALWWLGLEQFVVWGLLAGLFNSIPYLGPAFVTGGLGLVAFMQFGSLGKAAAICAAAVLITSLEGFLLKPALMSRASRINSAAIFTGLLFWSWLWGVWGTVLAVPMLMLIKACCDHLEAFQPIGELLGE